FRAVVLAAVHGRRGHEGENDDANCCDDTEHPARTRDIRKDSHWTSPEPTPLESASAYQTMPGREKLAGADIPGATKNVEIPDGQFEDALDGKIMTTSSLCRPGRSNAASASIRKDAGVRDGAVLSGISDSRIGYAI